MQKSVTGMRAKGFTLIEILIVLVIIGISLSFAIMAFGDFGKGRKLIMAAEQLKQVLMLAQQQAELENATLGLAINAKSYQILRFQEGKGWVMPPSNPLFKKHYFPTKILISLKPVSTKQPAIILYASGEMTAFSLSLGTTKATLATLEGNASGDLLVK